MATNVTQGGEDTKNMEGGAGSWQEKGRAGSGNVLRKTRDSFSVLGIDSTINLTILRSEVSVVIDGLNFVSQKLTLLPSEQRKLYFEKPEYVQLMKYVSLCPNSDPLTRGSIYGAISYMEEMLNHLESQLQQLPSQSQRRKYIESNPSIIELQSWISKYKEYAPYQ